MAGFKLVPVEGNPWEAPLPQGSSFFPLVNDPFSYTQAASGRTILLQPGSGPTVPEQLAQIMPKIREERRNRLRAAMERVNSAPEGGANWLTLLGHLGLAEGDVLADPSQAGNALLGGIKNTANWAGNTAAAIVAPLAKGMNGEYHSDEETADAAVALAAGMMGTGTLFPKPTTSLGVFGGGKMLTKLDSPARLAIPKVNEMVKAGASNEDIWNKTGWFEGADGEWRYEIPDHGMKLNLDKMPDPSKYKQLYAERLGEVQDMAKRDNISLNEAYALWHQNNPEKTKAIVAAYEAGTKVPLEKVLDHPALFEAYPHLRDLNVGVEDNPNFYGSYSPDQKLIKLRLTPITTDAKTAGSYTPQSTLMHEIQHSIQEHEGFSRGGNPAESEVRQAGSDIYNKARTELSGLLTEKAAFEEAAYRERLAKAQDLVKKANNSRSDSPEGIALQKYLASDEYGTTDAWAKANPEKAKRLSKLQDMILKTGMNPSFHAYQSLAGEVESRNVQARFSDPLSPMRPPWLTQDIPYEDQFLRFDNELIPWSPK